MNIKHKTSRKSAPYFSHRALRFFLHALFIFAFLFPALQCEFGVEETDFTPTAVIWRLLYCASSGDRYDRIDFTDMQDGTIRRDVVYVSNMECYGYSERIYSTSYIKKCLQGQKYQSGPNDCRGTGSSPDWGALKLQFCPTDDRACDMIVQDSSGFDIYVADPAISPAAKDCATDITAGRSWKLVREIGIHTYDLIVPNVLTIMPEVPTGITNAIWTEFSKSDMTLSNSYYFDSTSGLGTYIYPGALKNSNQYVLCVSQ